MGEHYASADEDDAELASKHDKAIEFLQRYATLVPEDPRPHEVLASIYESRDDTTKAEAEHREVVKLDPLNPVAYSNLTRFLVTKSRFKEALAVLDQTKGRGMSRDDILSSLFYIASDESGAAEQVEALAAAAPDRLASNWRANLNLASVRIAAGRAAEALPLLKRAAESPRRAESRTCGWLWLIDNSATGLRR